MLLSTTALVSAQMQEPRGNQPSAPAARDQGAPGGGAAGAEKGERSPGSAEKSTPGARGDKGPSAQTGEKGMGRDGDQKSRAQKSDGPSDRKGSAQADEKGKAGDTAREKTAEPKDKAGRDKAAETKDKAGKDKAAETKDKAGKDKAAETKDKAGKDKAAETKDKAGDRKQDTARDRDRDQTGKQRDQARQGKDDQRDQARGKDGQRDGDRVNLTQTQRTEFREKITRHREARVNNVNFSINVGTRVPRDFNLHVLPQDIVTIVPAYRGYRYFIVEERVVIVHPSRYEIVEIIEVDGGPRRGGTVSASFDLSRDQITLILDRLPDRRRADVRVDLALGAEVPSSVELYEFPQDIVAEVPDVRSYRYVMLERRVLIVDPSDREVVHILDR
jgi:hypothetical protein